MNAPCGAVASAYREATSSPLSSVVACACLEFTQTIFERFEPDTGSLEYGSLDVELFPRHEIHFSQAARQRRTKIRLGIRSQAAKFLRQRIEQVSRQSVD